MLSFKSFLEERTVDPVALGQRVARKHGKKTSFGKWEKVEKGGHIPLTGFNARESNSAANKLWKVQSKMGFDSKDKEQREKGKAQYHAEHSRKKIPIKDLHPTQPFVRTSDVDKLRGKVSETNPSHIHVVTHKGKHYVADGHHAVMAAKLRGDKEVEVNHIDLDKHK